MYNTRGKTKSESCTNTNNIVNMENNKGNESKEGSQGDLKNLIQLLTMKMQLEEQQQKTASITVDTFSKIVPDFTGENMAVEHWFTIFKKNADAYGLNEDQKYVQARNKMTGAAKLFLDSTVLCTYESLEAGVIEEFRKNYSSFDIHKALTDRKKKSGETFHEYMLQMRKIAAFGNIDTKSQIRYIVDGLKIKNEFKVNLYAAQNFSELRENYGIYEAVNGEKIGVDNEQQTTQNKHRRHKEEHCFNCGSKEHKRSDCNSVTKCFKCNKYGHISKNCRIENSEKSVQVISCNKRLKAVNFKNVDIIGLVDTGADVSLLKSAVYKKHFSSLKLEGYDTQLSGLGGSTTKPLGRIEGTLKVDNVQTQQSFLVVPDGAVKVDMILGFDFIDKFLLFGDENGYRFDEKIEVADEQVLVYNIAEVDVDFKHKEEVQQMIDNYKVATVVKQCPVKMEIMANAEVKPFRQSPSRLAAVEEEILNEQVNEWLQMEIIRKSTSDFASRVVVVKKKDSSYRICVDYRQLNKMVLKDGFPVPVIDDVILKLQKGVFFCVMDLKNGFFHVPIEEGSKKYTAFVTKRGLFEFNVAPFGFCNSPAWFIRYVNHIFQDLVNDEVMELYVDDIIIYGESAKQCMGKLEKVFKIAAQYGLKFNWKKCSFMKTEISFLGHIVKGGKIWPGKEKVKCVENFPIPKCVKEVQRFLGLSGYFRKFIEGYAVIVRPLTELLKKEVEFKICNTVLEAISKIKAALISEPLLRIYCRNAETELHTDASKDGFGAILLQKFDGELHPVYFWSKKTSVQEAAQHSYILEVKAAYLAIKKLRHLLLGIKFKLVTDCSAFKQTTAKKDISRSVAQWVIYLEDFTYEVEHRAGNRMKHVDSLSRSTVNVMTISTNITSRLNQLQKDDEYIKAVLTALKQGPYESYKVKGGLLYKTVQGNELLVVPKAMEYEIIRDAHENGHFAVEKTIHNIRQQYFIPHLERKVSKVVTNCVKCIIYNRKGGKKEGLLNCIEKSNEPLNTLHIDHLGPLDATTKQYKYVLALVDGFTKFVWLFATKTTSAEEVLRNLRIWSDIFGFPLRIVSDRGSAFTSGAFQEFCSSNNVEHILTTTGVPRGNGQVERVNRVIISIVSKVSSAEPSKWYKYLGDVQKAINSNVHSSTKHSPFHVMFGTKMRTKVDDSLLEMLEQEFVEQFDAERQLLRSDAKRQILEAQKRYKTNFDKNRKESSGYNINDLVAIKRTQFTPGQKLASEYLGPYKIVKVKRNQRYDVQKVGDCNGPSFTSTSIDNMKAWVCPIDEDSFSSETDA